jgi:hypothetical protein
VYSSFCKNKCVTGYKCYKDDCDKWDGTPPKPTYSPTYKPPYVPPKTTSKPSTPTTGVCAVPTGYKTPVGGYAAPYVHCNKDKTEYNSGSCFKLFTTDKTKCKSYKSQDIPYACQDACNLQYENCRNQYASSCSRYRLARRNTDVTPVEHMEEKRTIGYFIDWFNSWFGGYNTGTTDSYKNALTKCKAQKTACLNANTRASGAGYCPSYGVFKKY